MKKILITTALPYANGEIHIGHLLENIKADIWHRFNKQLGNQSYFVCGDDAHGAAIMLAAEKQGLKPEQQIADILEQHKLSFSAFGIEFDNFYTTHSDENKQLVFDIYNKLLKAGYIEKREINQLYDEKKEIFLADRFVKGQCPNCKSENQYGDSCDNCGATYDAKALINPISVYSDTKPKLKKSLHYFFTLEKFRNFLSQYIIGATQPEVANKLKEWLKNDLLNWDISRDAPFFGFKIPNEQNKYFYVWFDAPIGYMASFKNFCDKQNLSFNSFWQKDSNAEIHHFIGKDIIYFHALFWPAVLKGSGYKIPTSIKTNGFITLNGKKMSKSKGNFITALNLAEFFEPEALRYYFSAKLTNKVIDIDLNLTDFVVKVNTDLVGKIVNIASRCSKILKQYNNNQTTAKLDYQILAKFDDKLIIKDFEQLNLQSAINRILELADIANKYINDQKPWYLIKKNIEQANIVCSTGINMFYHLMIYLHPVVPKLAQRSFSFLKISDYSYSTKKKELINHQLDQFTVLFTRLNESNIDKLTKEILQEKEIKKMINNTETKEKLIDFKDFAKLDLRMGLVKECKKVEQADKLLEFKIEIHDGKILNILSSIADQKTPKEMIGKLLLVCINLKPKKLKFGISEGMILMAENEKQKIFLLEAEDAKPGDKVY